MMIKKSLIKLIDSCLQYRTLCFTKLAAIDYQAELLLAEAMVEDAGSAQLLNNIAHVYDQIADLTGENIEEYKAYMEGSEYIFQITKQVIENEGAENDFVNQFLMLIGDDVTEGAEDVSEKWKDQLETAEEYDEDYPPPSEESLQGLLQEQNVSELDQIQKDMKYREELAVMQRITYNLEEKRKRAREWFKNKIFDPRFRQKHNERIAQYRQMMKDERPEEYAEYLKKQRMRVHRRMEEMGQEAWNRRYKKHMRNRPEAKKKRQEKLKKQRQETALQKRLRQMGLSHLDT